jgi:hypothetical protein
MSKLIIVDFKNAKKHPENFTSDWILSECKKERYIKCYVSFKVYKTESKFAVQFFYRVIHQHKVTPDEYHKYRPHYFRSLENLWKYTLDDLANLNVNKKNIAKFLMKERIKQKFVSIE